MFKSLFSREENKKNSFGEMLGYYSFFLDILFDLSLSCANGKVNDTDRKLR
jgi:hypothetical protein